MLSVSESTKVILIPEGISDFDVIYLTIGNDHKSLAVSNGLVYELREIGPSSEYDNRGEPQLPSGEPVRSLIFETNEYSSNGAVLSNPNFITLTRYDFVFSFLQWVSPQLDVYMSRFHSNEDIMEGFFNATSSYQSLESLESIIQDCVDRTCDYVEENGEKFYKINLMKVNALLANKINGFKNLIISNPTYAISKKIKGTLSDSHDGIPEMVFEQQVLRYCTDFVFASFLSNNLKNIYTKEYVIDYPELDSFLKNQETKQKSAAIAEQNLASMSVKKNIESDKSKVAKTHKSQKKKADKVAVGKGALDHFFKRN